MIISIVSISSESPLKDLSIDASHISRQLILVEISGKSVGNHHGTVYCIANILGTTTIDDSLLGTEDTPFILLRIILE